MIKNNVRLLSLFLCLSAVSFADYTNRSGQMIKKLFLGDTTSKEEAQEQSTTEQKVQTTTTSKNQSDSQQLYQKLQTTKVKKLEVALEHIRNMENAKLDIDFDPPTDDRQNFNAIEMDEDLNIQLASERSAIVANEEKARIARELASRPHPTSNVAKNKRTRSFLDRVRHAMNEKKAPKPEPAKKEEPKKETPKEEKPAPRYDSKVKGLVY